MFKKFLLILILLTVGLTAAWAYPPYPVAYPLTGKVTGPSGVDLGGRTVRFYLDATKGVATATTAADGSFTINIFDIWSDSIVVGADYSIDSPIKDGYEGKVMKGKFVTGYGYDSLPNPLTLTGTSEIPKEPAPSVKIWFGNRLYQPEVYWVEEKGNRPFVVTNTPQIKVDLDIEAPYTLAKDISAHQIVIDAGASTAKTLDLTGANATINKTFAAGTGADEGKISSMSLTYNIAAGEELAEGKHTVSVTSHSSGLLGTAAEMTETATVEVMGGPLSVIGIPITFPSPFSITKNKMVTIQYELNRDGNITVYLFSPTGQIIKRWDCAAGGEGGSAGVNKIIWDGRTDQGYLAGNAIYLGSILSKDDYRLLAKYKLTIVD